MNAQCLQQLLPKTNYFHFGHTIFSKRFILERMRGKVKVMSNILLSDPDLTSIWPCLCLHSLGFGKSSKNIFAHFFNQGGREWYLQIRILKTREFVCQKMLYDKTSLPLHTLYTKKEYVLIPSPYICVDYSCKSNELLGPPCHWRCLSKKDKI